MSKKKSGKREIENGTDIFNSFKLLGTDTYIVNAINMLASPPQKPQNDWFSISAKGGKGEVFIYGEISMWDVSAKEFAKAWRAMGKMTECDVRINSIGGSVIEGTAIFNLIKQDDATINVFIDGAAISMGSVIAMAGDTIEMADNALMMIHNPLTGVWGNAAELRKTADVLDKFKTALITSYTSKTGLDTAVVSEMMDDETWMTAEEARDLGFADEIGDPIDPDEEAEGAFDLSVYANAPDWALKRFNALNTQQVSKLVASPTSDFTDNQPQEVITMSKKKTSTLNGGDTSTGVPAATATAASPVATAVAATIGTTAAPGTSVAPGATADATQAAVKANQDRVDSIETLFDNPVYAKFGDLRKSCVTNINCSIEMARTQLLDKMGEAATPVNGAGVIITGGEDVRDKFVAGATNAILARVGLEKDDTNNEYRGMTLREMARCALQAANVNVSGMSGMNIVGMAFTHSTSDFAQVLADSANKSMLRGYNEAEETFEAWTKVGNLSDFKVARRAGLSEFSALDLVNESGEFKHGTFSDRGELIQLGTYGKLFSISRQAVINDDLQAFSDIPQKMGQAAKRKVGDLAYGVLTANADMADGTALFHADHNNLATVAALPTTASLDAGRTAMQKQKDSSGQATLNVRPNVAMVPAALFGAMTVVVESETEIASGQNNSKKPNMAAGVVNTVVSDARLDADSGTSWYLAANPSSFDTVEIGYLDGNPAPFMEEQNGWTVDGVEFKVRIDAAAKALEHTTLYKNAGA